MKSEQIKAITEKATEQLVAALDAGHSETLNAYLKAIGRFHRYSLHNVMLIASQKPNASHVAGFHTWNQLGRFVKKGDKGIVILAPVLRRKEKENEELAETTSAVAGFRSAYVFDITQTDGKELPALGTVQGEPKDSTDRLQAFARTQGIFARILGPDRARPWRLLWRESRTFARPDPGRGVFHLDPRTGAQTPASR